MYSYKYIILFIVLAWGSHNFSYGQISVDLGAQGIVPLRQYTEDYKTGFGAFVQAGKTFNEKHMISVQPGFINIPGRETSDKYLEYTQPAILVYPVEVGYTYKIGAGFQLYGAFGPAFFQKPDTQTGQVIAIKAGYNWRKITLYTGIIRLFHEGNMDVFSVQLAYRLF